MVQHQEQKTLGVANSLRRTAKEQQRLDCRGRQPLLGTIGVARANCRARRCNPGSTAFQLASNSWSGGLADRPACIEQFIPCTSLCPVIARTWQQVARTREDDSAGKTAATARVSVGCDGQPARDENRRGRPEST